MFVSQNIVKSLNPKHLRSILNNYRRVYCVQKVLRNNIKDIKVKQALQRNAINSHNRYRTYATQIHEHKQDIKGKVKVDQVKNPIEGILDNLGKFGRVFLNQIYDVLNSDLGNLSDEQATLLLQCCGSVLANQTPEIRANLCDHVWDSLKRAGAPLNYQTYVSICTENKHEVDYKRLCAEIKDIDINLYKIILENVSQVGDTVMAYRILEEMKSKNFPADEETFNCLVLAHAINGGLTEAQTVLKTMKTVHVPPSTTTYVALLRGLATRNDKNEFLSALRLLPSPLSEKAFLQILKELGENDNQDWLSNVLEKADSKSVSLHNLRYLDNICIQLIYLERPFVAVSIYAKVVENSPNIPEGNYGLFLLREMLKKGVTPKEILKAAQHLKELNLNPVAQEKVTEMALRNNYVELAWELLKSMNPLRCHYFWPLLIKAAKKDGEPGLFEAINKMIDLGVRPDDATLEFYVFPNCDYSNPLNLVRRLKDLGFTVRELMTPLLKVLLKSNKIDLAKSLCEAHDIQVDGKSTLPLLSTAWTRTFDAQNVVPILQKICETNSRTIDWTGDFLVRTLRSCEKSSDLKKILQLAKLINTKKLRVSPICADILSNINKTKGNPKELSRKIDECIDSLLDLSFKTDEQHIPHPRDMDLNELECHYEELKSKGMETRGVLRKLIQMHSRFGNSKRVDELRKVFKELRYPESPGMKASVMHNYVLAKNLHEAVKVYEDIASKHPWFRLDSFKILDLATLMASNDQAEKALNLLKRETNIHNFCGSRSIEHNCVDLLNSFKDAGQQKEVFNLLIKAGYCVPNGVTLEPLVRIHLKNNDVLMATEVFLDLSNKYKATPMHIELLCALVEHNEYSRLQDVLRATAGVHGRSSAQTGIITAIAKKGLHKTITKIILENNGISRENLLVICSKFVKENGLSELKILAKAVRNLSHNIVDKSIIYRAIMTVYSNKNDCESALSFWQGLEEDEDFDRNLLESELVSLMKRCKYDIPDELKSKLSLSNS